MKTKPANIIVEVEGGRVVGVVSDRVVNCFVVDHDHDGIPIENLVDFPDGKDRTTKVSVEDNTPADRSPGFVKFALKTLGYKSK